jgi:hypothetical protein
MNPKLTKFLVKGGLTVLSSVVIAYTIKMEKKAADRIDEHFDNSDAQDD